MANDEIEIKIVEEDVSPFVPEDSERPGIKKRMSQATAQVGDQVAQTAKKAWGSQARKKVTGSAKKGAAIVAKKSGQVVHDRVMKTAEKQAREQAAAVQQRLQETDWKEASKTGTAKGLRWLSQKLAQLAARFTPEKEPPTPAESASEE